MVLPAVIVLFVHSGADKDTLALGIYQFEIEMTYRSNVPIYYCAILLSTLPILIVFCVFQETIMENTVAGGLKA